MVPDNAVDRALYLDFTPDYESVLFNGIYGEESWYGIVENDHFVNAYGE